MVTYFMFKFLARNNLWQRKDHFWTDFSGVHAAVIGERIMLKKKKMKAKMVQVSLQKL